MIRIIGIDPGSRRTGYGVVDKKGARVTYVASGVIRLPELDLSRRLKIIFDSLNELLEQYAPQQMAVEEVFFARDPRAALKLGQARGAAILAGVNNNLDVAEYSPRSVKQSVVGTGAASKKQVQAMVTQLLKLPGVPAEDAADALAIALCHAHSMRIVAGTAGVTRYARNRLR